jgi:hypothetical protein
MRHWRPIRIIRPGALFRDQTLERGPRSVVSRRWQLAKTTTRFALAASLDDAPQSFDARTVTCSDESLSRSALSCEADANS